MTRRWLPAWWTVPRVRHALLEGLIALCLAFIVWLYLHSRAKLALEHVQLPVKVRIAAAQRDQYVVDIEGTPRVTASFTGAAARIRELRQKLLRGQLQVVIDYVVAGGRQQDATFCDTLRVEAARLPTPPGVTAELLDETAAISVTVHRLSERALPVKLDYTGDARVTQIKVEPPTVQVRGPKHILDRAQAILTAPHVFAANPEENADPVVKGQIGVALELEGRPVEITPAQVAFQCKVTPKKRLYELRDVPVQFLCPSEFLWRPRFVDETQGKVTLRLIGPTSDEPPPVLAYVDLTKGTFGRGRGLEPLRLQLPKDFYLADPSPHLVAFELEESIRAAKQGEPRDLTPWTVERRNPMNWNVEPQRPKPMKRDGDNP